jgi:hypothetical protein
MSIGNTLCPFGIFYALWEYVTDIWNILHMIIWYILCSFGKLFPVLVSCTEKNLAAPIRFSSIVPIVQFSTHCSQHCDQFSSQKRRNYRICEYLHTYVDHKVAPSLLNDRFEPTYAGTRTGKQTLNYNSGASRYLTKFGSFINKDIYKF